MRESTQNLTIKYVEQRKLQALRLRAVIEGYASRSALLRAMIDTYAEPYLDVPEEALKELEKDILDEGE